MGLVEGLNISSGVTCFIGSGGKTTTIETLAKELATEGRRVAITTTTHMMAPTAFPLVSDVAEVRHAILTNPVTYVGKPCGKGKICQLVDPVALRTIADYVLVEADGSARKPLKLHNATEPVIPEGADAVIAVIGASGLGRPVGQAMHRWELRFKNPKLEATPELVADSLVKDLGGCDLFINQAEDHPVEAADLAGELMDREWEGDIYVGSAQAGEADIVW